MPGALFSFVERRQEKRIPVFRPASRLPKNHSSGVTGVRADGGAGAGGAAFCAGAGSTVPGASCGAAAGRLRGTGVAVADLVAGLGATACGGEGLCGVTAAERGAGAIT
jgi:hypothetical protein